MKKFRFPLRSVQTVRALHEMRAREQFSAALHAHAMAQERLAAVRRDVEALEKLLVEERRRAVQAADQVAFIRAHHLSLDQCRLAEKACQDAAAVLAERREAWIEARRDLRVIENLEGKARQEYRREYEREEQALLDDRTSAVAGRPPLLMS